MKIKTSLILDIRRTGEFISGTLTANGIRQDLRMIPKDVEFSDLTKWITSHVMPMIEMGQHGSQSYRKGRPDLT